MAQSGYRYGQQTPEQLAAAMALGAQGPQWHVDERGLAYSINPDGTRRYNAPSPFAAGRPGDSFFRDTVWDDKTGTWKKATNWNNILALAAGSTVGAGAISGAVSGGAATTATPLAQVGATAPAAGAGAGATTAAVAPAVNWAAAPSTAGLFAPEGLVGTTAATTAAPAAGAVAPAAAAAAKGGFWNTLKKIGGKLFGSDAGKVALSSGADLAAAKIAADAARHAADQQFEFGMQALNFEKQRYTDAQGNLQPWIGAGKKALGAVGNALMPENGPAPTADNLAPRWISGLQANAQNNGRSLVSMRAPTGEVQQVPSFQVPHYQSAGAKVI